MAGLNSANDKRKHQGHCIKPRLVLERSFVNSVTELVCNAMPNQPNSPSANEKIEWVSFAEECDLSDKSIKKYLEKIIGPDLPIIIVIGYTYGYQIWALLSNGECEELLSVRDLPVNCVKFLPQPKINDFRGNVDKFIQHRPLIAVSHGNGSNQRFSFINIYSLKNGVDPLKRFNFERSVLNILINDRAMLVVFLDRMLVINCLTFEERFWIRNCHNELNPNSVSLSAYFLAYSDSAINPTFQSCGGVSTADDGSYTSQVVLAAKNLGKTVSDIGVSLASSLSGGGQKPRRYPGGSPKKSESNEKTGGVVTILHLDQIKDKEFDVESATDGTGILCHFLANADEPVSSIKFNHNGSLLLTCGPSGQRFDVFQILAHPSSPCLGTVQHLYVLQRGSTVAKILNIAFSIDSRWVAVSTGNGTTHIFPITPYGGPINVRTHTGPRVVNRESRFHRSAGLDHLDTGPFGNPTTSSNTSYSPLKPGEQHLSSAHPSLFRTASNPRLLPYAPPTTLLAASKIKQAPSALFAGGGGADAAAGPSSSSMAAGGGVSQSSSTASRRRVSSTMAPDVPYRRLAAFFAAGRSVGAPPVVPSASSGATQGGHHRTDFSPDSLYILRCNGQLNEYKLSVKPFSIGSRVSEENPVELHVIPTVEWPLSRCKAELDTCLPLPDDHLLLQAACVKARLEKYSKEHKVPPPNRDLWISQVEMVTYNGPHRRLWMGPQFTFKTYLDSQRSASLVYPSLPGCSGPGRSEPISIGPPFGSSTHTVPVMIEACSLGSFDPHHHQPHHLAGALQLLDVCGGVWSSDNDFVPSSTTDDARGELRQCIAEAMLDQQLATPPKDGAADVEEFSNSS